MSTTAPPEKVEDIEDLDIKSETHRAHIQKRLAIEVKDLRSQMEKNSRVQWFLTGAIAFFSVVQIAIYKGVI